MIVSSDTRGNMFQQIAGEMGTGPRALQEMSLRFSVHEYKSSTWNRVSSAGTDRLSHRFLPRNTHVIVKE